MHVKFPNKLLEMHKNNQMLYGLIRAYIYKHVGIWFLFCKQQWAISNFSGLHGHFLKNETKM